MTLPPWPAEPPACGQVLLRAVEARDAVMAQQLSTDPYVPQTGSLPGNATMQEASDWVERQQGRHAEGTGFSFKIARRTEEFAIGHCGLWLKDLDEEQASAGYAVAPSERGRGYAAEALAALTEFGWTVPGVQRIALFIEPWNIASIRTAERAGYVREELLVSHQLVGGECRDMILYSSVRRATPGGDEPHGRLARYGLPLHRPMAGSKQSRRPGAEPRHDTLRDLIRNRLRAGRWLWEIGALHLRLPPPSGTCGELCRLRPPGALSGRRNCRGFS